MLYIQYTVLSILNLVNVRCRYILEGVTKAALPLDAGDSVQSKEDRCAVVCVFRLAIVIVIIVAFGRIARRRGGR